MKGSAERKTLSIVVACRNESKHIGTLIDSILAQDLAGFEWEAIIADGMSEDGTRELLAAVSRTHPHITVVNNSGRIVSCGLNAAIRAARGEIILRMDAHTEYAPDYVRKCVMTLEKTGADNVGGPARTKAAGLIPRAIQAAYHSRFSTGGARFHDVSYSGFVDTVPYGCWRKNKLEELGLFDEKLVRNQDDELNLRLTRTGGKILAIVHHRVLVSAANDNYVAVSAIFSIRFLESTFGPKTPHAGFVATHGSRYVRACQSRYAVGCISLRVYRPCAAGAQNTSAVDDWTSCYAFACCAAAVQSARVAGWDVGACLPLIFAVFHFSYGLGFLVGFLYWPFERRVGVRLGELFVGLSR